MTESERQLQATLARVAAANTAASAAVPGTLGSPGAIGHAEERNASALGMQGDEECLPAQVGGKAVGHRAAEQCLRKETAEPF